MMWVGRLRRLHGEGQCKGWLSEERAKGQNTEMKSIKAKSHADVHRNEEMVFHSGISSQYQTISYTVKLSC